MLYQVQFTNGKIFNGGDSYKVTNWKEMPDLEIKSIAFLLPDGNLLVLKDYEEYNHIVEATQDVYGSTKFTLRYQYLMGRKNNKVTSYRIVLFETKDSKFKIGDITRREYEYGKEYSGSGTKGWKKGITK
jgi:hypothetical protein